MFEETHLEEPWAGSVSTLLSACCDLKQIHWVDALEVFSPVVEQEPRTVIHVKRAKMFDPVG